MCWLLKLEQMVWEAELPSLTRLRPAGLEVEAHLSNSQGPSSPPIIDPPALEVNTPEEYLENTVQAILLNTTRP
jgi:hypothetical protein